MQTACKLRFFAHFCLVSPAPKSYETASSDFKVRLPWLIGLISLLCWFGSATPASAMTSGAKVANAANDERHTNNSVKQDGEDNTAVSLAKSPSENQRDEGSLNLLADIRAHSAEELMQLLARTNRLFEQGSIDADTTSPVIFLLHGSEARALFKDNYRQHKEVVDLAARLSAFGVVDIKVCETWANNKGLDKNNLQPFVNTVPYAPAEEKVLIEQEGYVYF